MPDVLARAPDDLVRVLDADGEVVAPELLPDLDDGTLRDIYCDMRFCRRFDERMTALQRRGRVGTYAPLAGQEAAQIGSGGCPGSTCSTGWATSGATPLSPTWTCSR